MNSKHKKLIVIGAAIVLLVLCLFVFGGKAKKQDDRALSDFSEEPTTEAVVASDSDSGAELENDVAMMQEELKEDMASLSDASETDAQATITNATQATAFKSKYDIRIKKIMADMTLSQKVAQMFIITPETLTGYSAVYKAENVTKQAYNSKPVGGLIYRKPNIISEDQTKKMLMNTLDYSEDISGVPAMLCIDKESTEIDMILESDKFDTEELDVENDAVIGDYLWSLGFNVEFGPIITGNYLANSSITGVFKHFPGVMSRGELTSYGNAIKDNKGMIMVANTPVEGYTGDIPACLSEEIITTILRGDMQYQGVVITDSLSDSGVKSKYNAGQAATMAVDAGADMIYLPSDYNGAYNAIMSAVKKGDITEERIDESVYRILDAKLNLKPHPSDE